MSQEPYVIGEIIEVKPHNSDDWLRAEYIGREAYMVECRLCASGEVIKVDFQATRGIS